MGVYIPNMEKPKQCSKFDGGMYEECPVLHRGDICDLIDEYYEDDIERYSHCPLIEIDETVIRLGMKFCGLVAKVDDIMKAENGERSE